MTPRNLGEMTIRERDAKLEDYHRRLLAEKEARGELYERWGSQATDMLDPLINLLEKTQWLSPWQVYQVLEGFFGE